MFQHEIVGKFFENLAVFVKDGLEFFDCFHDRLAHKHFQSLIGGFLFEPLIFFSRHLFNGSDGFCHSLGMADAEEFRKDEKIVIFEKSASIFVQNTG